MGENGLALSTVRVIMVNMVEQAAPKRAHRRSITPGRVRLVLENTGPLRHAEVLFGDLTILVGPQATGKSIFLQFLKLIFDTGYIHNELRRHGIDWERSPQVFLDVYLGEGLGGIWRGEEGGSAALLNGRRLQLDALIQPRNRRQYPTVFYIPAQRVLSLANGWPRAFQSFASQDPFVVRDFSETFRFLMEQEFSRSPDLFPKTNRLKTEYRQLLSRHLFGDFRLAVDRHGPQKRLVLQDSQGKTSIPFMAWSAGQREFVPLLMGLYWLLPSAKVSSREELEWVVIEEPEMGLHPNGISAVLLLVLELMWRGYRVCISTHSPHVLDVVWALRVIQEHKGNWDSLLRVFETPKSDPMRRVAESVLAKKARVYYFDRDGTTKDISGLDPGSDEAAEAGWGGLSEFSGRVAEVVASIVNASARRLL